MVSRPILYLKLSLQLAKATSQVRQSWKRQKKTKSKNNKKEVDVNPVYGIYALNEEGEDISVTEVRDTNDYYFK